MYCVLTSKISPMDLGDGQRWATSQAQPWQQREYISQADENVASLTQEVVHHDLGDGQRWAAPQGQSSQAGQRWAASQAHLRHKWREPHERSCDVLQPSIPSPSKQGKDIQRGGRALVNSLLQCAQAMAFTFVMYHVTQEWLRVYCHHDTPHRPPLLEGHHCYTTPSPPDRPPPIRP
ncbi:hypothetical protein E2C01_018215 [Portunus trituberculatus]|uniref:Uncharacterized protein n=1 Tax=Portunus trituberculatus TaxID=210409 RepID=A0A5B7DUY0_PORTR|nr:hypothetical protein [Portunus trituberculatus]